MAGLIALAILVLGWPLLPWRRLGVAARSLAGRLGWGHAPEPIGRPIEEIARDARRLRIAFRATPRGTSFVKYEAHRRAYDDVLLEGCRALGVTTLLGVLGPSPELDAERDRIEGRLELFGLDLDLPL
ncbi:MAG: hypothetical protein U0R78_16150 [Nocardioidaceae bacterium]